MVLIVPVQGHVIEVEHNAGQDDEGLREVLRQLGQEVLADDEARDIDVTPVVVVANCLDVHTGVPAKSLLPKLD